MTFDNITYHIDIDFSNDHLAINLSWKYLTCKMLSTTLFRMFNRKMVLSLNLRQQFLHWGASLSNIVICVIFKYYQSVSLAKLDFNIKTISKRFH